MGRFEWIAREWEFSILLFLHLFGLLISFEWISRSSCSAFWFSCSQVLLAQVVNDINATANQFLCNFLLDNGFFLLLHTRHDYFASFIAGFVFILVINTETLAAAADESCYWIFRFFFRSSFSHIINSRKRYLFKKYFATHNLPTDTENFGSFHFRHFFFQVARTSENFVVLRN